MESQESLPCSALRNKKPTRSKWIRPCSGKAILWDIDSDPEDHEQLRPLFHIDQCFFIPPPRPKPMSLRNRMGGKPYSHAWPLDTAPLHSGALWKCPGWSLSCQIIHLRPEFQKNGQTSILIMSYPDVPFLHALPPVGAIFQPKMCGFETILKHTPIRHLFSLILGKGARRRYVRRVRSLKPEAPGVQISK